jgi:CubicO group peptidase (beta-lactamase class C family)
VKRAHWLWAIALIAGLIEPAPAAETAAGPASEPRALAGSTAAGLDLLGGRVDSIFAPYARRDCPGCAVGVSLDGRTVLLRGYGMADLEHDVPITPTTLFEAGSVSKQFVAAAILLLAQEGRLSLDDDLRRWLPELQDFGRPVTIRQVLSHTSGLRDHWTLLDLAGRPTGEVVHTLPEVLALARRQKRLNFEPGTRYLYSNLGYILAGLIVQRASGDSLPAFTRKRLSGPLALASTSWRDDFRRIVPGRAQAYSRASGGRFQLDMPFSQVYGSGGVLTTVEDLLRWNAALDSDRVGRPGLASLLATPIRLRDGRSTDYGLGLGIVDRDGFQEIRHGGATAGYRAYLTRHPRERLSIALLCNRGDANTDSLARRVAEAVFGFFLGQRPAAPPVIELAPEELQSLAGLYRNTVTGEVQRVTVRDGVARHGWGGGAPLVSLGQARFRTAGLPYTEVRFRRLAGKREMSVGKDEPFEFLEVAEATHARGRSSELAGTYHSAELDVRYSVIARGDTLLLRRPVLREERLVPMDPDGYRAIRSGDQLKFTRDSRGAVNGFEVYAGRVLHLRFTREPSPGRRARR